MNNDSVDHFIEIIGTSLSSYTRENSSFTAFDLQILLFLETRKLKLEKEYLAFQITGCYLSLKIMLACLFQWNLP